MPTYYITKFKFKYGINTFIFMLSVICINKIIVVKICHEHRDILKTKFSFEKILDSY